MKFGIEPGDKEAVQQLCRSYLEGLSWVLTYYHNGCDHIFIFLAHNFIMPHLCLFFD